MERNIIQTGAAPAAIGPYSQAVKFGGLLFVSGQIPIDPGTGNLVMGGIVSEAHRVMQNIGAILEAAGCGYEDIIKSTLFIRSMDDFAAVNTVYASYFSGEFPARETVEVSGLPKGAAIEISVVAGKSGWPGRRIALITETHEVIGINKFSKFSMLSL